MPEAPGYQGPRGRAGSPGAGLRTSGHVGGRGWCPSCRWASRRLPEVRSCWGRAGHATASDCGTPSPVHGGPWACSGHRPGGPGFRVPKIMTVHQLHPCACPREPPWPDACSNSHLHIRGGGVLGSCVVPPSGRHLHLAQIHALLPPPTPGHGLGCQGPVLCPQRPQCSGPGCVGVTLTAVTVDTGHLGTRSCPSGSGKASSGPRVPAVSLVGGGHTHWVG